MLSGQANKGKKRKNSGNTKRNLNKRAAISYANLSSSSSKYMSNLSKHSDIDFEEIEEDTEEVIEESSIIEGFQQDSELSSGTNSLSSKTVSFKEATESTEASQDSSMSQDTSMSQDSISSISLMSIMEQNWSVLIEKLSQSAFWKEHEYSLNSMEKDIDALRNENRALRQRLMLTEGR